MIPPLLALFSWPAVVAVLFRKLDIPMALLISLIAGYLLLPEKTEVDWPLLPTLDKTSVPVLAALVMGYIAISRSGVNIGRPDWIPRHWLTRSLLALFVFGAFMTAITNGDFLTYGPRVIQPLGIYDAFSTVLSGIIFLLPLIMARKFLADPKAHRLLLLTLCIAGLSYSLLALYEIRMSPQLNRMLYGFFPHSWIQHIRGNGFRPLVFLNHGLWLAIFLTGAIFAALGLFRTTPNPRRLLFLGAALWLFLTLVLAKSLGALIITLLLIPAVLFLGVRTHLLVAAIIAGLVLTYPLARGVGLIPVDSIMSVANQINPYRAASLGTRLWNEDALLAKAQERPLFGWGGYGRARIYDDNGGDTNILDGYWVITIGLGGWVRYLAELGLLTAPLFLLALRRRQYEIGMETSVLAIILAGNLVDMIPNGTLTPLTWLMVGALWGRLELQKIEDSETVVPEPEDTRRQRQYSSPRPAREAAQEPPPPERDVVQKPPAAAPPERGARSYTRQRNKVYRQKKPGS